MNNGCNVGVGNNVDGRAGSWGVHDAQGPCWMDEGILKILRLYLEWVQVVRVVNPMMSL